MAYTKTTWVDDSAPAINADNLNNMETGIGDAHDELALLRPSSLDAHGTVSSGTEEISFNFTEHSLTTAGSHTWTVADASATQPDTSVELVVTSTTTITIDGAFFSSQKLSALSPNTYLVELKRLTIDGSKTLAVAVGAKQ